MQALLTKGPNHLSKVRNNTFITLEFKSTVRMGLSLPSKATIETSCEDNFEKTG